MNFNSSMLFLQLCYKACLKLFCCGTFNLCCFLKILTVCVFMNCCKSLSYQPFVLTLDLQYQTFLPLLFSFGSLKRQIDSCQPYIPCRCRWTDTLSLIGRLVNESCHRKLLTSVSAVTVGLCAGDSLLKPVLSNPLNQPAHSCRGIMGLAGNPTISLKT